MKASIVCLIFIISETNSFYIDGTFHKDVEEKGVLLRKLQNLQEHDSRNVSQTPSWSEVLADILVKRVFSFHRPNNETEHITETEDIDSILVKAVSFVIKIYKNYVYDKLRNRVDTQYSVNTHFVKIDNDTKVNGSNKTDDPNDEIELIEPKYHGKLCDNCSELNPEEIEISDSECGKGLLRDGNGNCVDTKPSKFILAIPQQCPTGYGRDWLGYCRVTL